MPISAAKRSTMRSRAAAASGRPAPRYEVLGVVVVSTDRQVISTVGIS